MPRAERIPVSQVMKEKDVTKSCVHQAIKYGNLNAEEFGRITAVLVDSAYETWTPDRARQKSAHKRWSKKGEK